MMAAPETETETEAKATLSQADARALQRMHAVDPVWRGVAVAGDVMDFPARTILHAGPPVDLQNLALPILNSAIMAVLFEGWAREADQARAMLLAGEINLAPAQDHRAMVPLAAVLSPGMAVQIVLDGHNPRNRIFAPLNGGMKYAQRLGLAGDHILAHLRWINGNLAAALSIVADCDVPLIAIADEAISRGDDCHGKTAEASRLTIEQIAPRLGSNTPERRFLDAAPGFFLNIWMAGVKCMAMAGEGEGSSIVTAMGANGITTGVKLGARPDHWVMMPAAPPEGPLNPGFEQSDRLGAIGDSALVDAMGFGAMLPSAQQMRGTGSIHHLSPHSHPGFRGNEIHVGFPAGNISEDIPAPVIALGILDRRGAGGRIGGGLYATPPALFRKAYQDIQNRDMQGQSATCSGHG